MAWQIAVALGLGSRTGKAAAARHAKRRDAEANRKRKSAAAKNNEESQSRLTHIHHGDRFQATCSRPNGQCYQAAEYGINVQAIAELLTARKEMEHN
jgi:hypothetical protein